MFFFAHTGRQLQDFPIYANPSPDLFFHGMGNDEQILLTADLVLDSQTKPIQRMVYMA